MEHTEPVRSFQIEAVEASDDSDNFNITCTALGVFPEPELRLFKVRSINETLEATEVKSTVFSFKSMSDGFYSITLISNLDNANNNGNENNIDDDAAAATAAVDEEDDNSLPARKRLALKRNEPKKRKPIIAEHYECRLAIPHSDYAVTRRLAIQDGKHWVLDNRESCSIRFTLLMQ